MVAHVAVGVDGLPDRGFDLLKVSQPGREGPDVGSRGSIPQPLAECPHAAAYPQGVGHVEKGPGLQPCTGHAGLVQGRADVLDAPQGNRLGLVQETAHLGDGLQVVPDHDDVSARFQGHGPVVAGRETVLSEHMVLTASNSSTFSVWGGIPGFMFSRSRIVNVRPLTSGRLPG